VPTARNCYRLAWGVAVATLLFLVLAAGALGIIGSGGSADRMYLGVLAVAAVGTLVARLRASGMAWALTATAAATALVAVIALATGLQETAGGSVGDVVMVNAMFVALFGLSAWLFRRSAQT
jgi:hypothetical protein